MKSNIVIDQLSVERCCKIPFLSCSRWLCLPFVSHWTELRLSSRIKNWKVTFPRLFSSAVSNTLTGWERGVSFCVVSLINKLFACVKGTFPCFNVVRFLEARWCWVYTPTQTACHHSSNNYCNTWALFLGCTHVMRRTCWCTKQWQNVAQLLHNNRTKFPKDFFHHCSVHQHGRRDVRCKPRILNRWGITAEIGHFWVHFSLYFKASLSHEYQFSFILKFEPITVTKISYLGSLWKWDWGELGSGLFPWLIELVES